MSYTWSLLPSPLPAEDAGGHQYLILGFNDRLEALVVDEEGRIRPFDYVDLKTVGITLVDFGAESMR